VTRVGLFVDQDPAQIRRCLPHLDLLQFHGDEAPDLCRSFGRPWIKALRMREGMDLDAHAALYSEASGLLLDAYRPGVPGGTGERFDWSRIPASLAKPVILAGGLSHENVTQAIVGVRPFAVDVSGGIETSPGVKDARLMSAFLRAVRQGDETPTRH
jgi:phosphoribosylanthranilate isomerase